MGCCVVDVLRSGGVVWWGCCVVDVLCEGGVMVGVLCGGGVKSVV